MAMALLAYRNTPDRDTGRSPAQVLFARQLRDGVPCDPSRLRLQKEWVLTREAREKALSKRHEIREVQLEEHTRALKPLVVGTPVQIQNQAGPHKNKWDVSGTVVEVLDIEAYLVKLDGFGRVSKRNRRFICPIVPYNTVMVPRSNATITGRRACSDAASVHGGTVGPASGTSRTKSNDVGSENVRAVLHQGGPMGNLCSRDNTVKGADLH